MYIKSNTAGKLNKIINGNVFPNEFIFVKEFLQNAQRAKATSVYIDVDEYSITFRDNGKGCKKPDNIFTLDLSEWDTTDEGFGMGFWSCLAFNGLEKITARSFKWKASISVKEIINNNLEVSLEKDLDSFDGFEVVLNTVSMDKSKITSLKYEILSVAKYLDFDTFYNNELVDKIDIFSEVDGDFVLFVENRDFKAKLSISDVNYNPPTLFYDKREVCTLYNSGYIYGVIEAKKGKINLKEPDRTAFIYDGKHRNFKQRLAKEVKKLFIEFLKSNPSKDLIDKYCDAIDFHLDDVKDYEKYLDFDLIVEDMNDSNKDDLPKKEESNRDNYVPYVQDLGYRNFSDNIKEDANDYSIELDENTGTRNDTQDINKDGIVDNNSDKLEINMPKDKDTDLLEEVYTTDNNSYEENSYNNQEEYKEDNCDWKDNSNQKDNKVTNHDKNVYSMDDYVVSNHDRASHYNNAKDNAIKPNETFEESKYSKFKRFITSKNKIAWVLRDEVDMYTEEIAQAQYAGIKVLKAENILYANVLDKYNKMHISKFKKCFKETFNFKNIEVKNFKEKRLLQNLVPICEKYNLPINTFVIGNIEVQSSLEYKGKTLFREKSKNTKNNVKIFAVEDNGLIILDRVALNLSRFKLVKDSAFGINDLKSIFAVSSTIAHELAHLLYSTQDNTIEHYKAESRILREITDLYLK